MKNLFLQTLSAVERGTSFRIDLANRTLKVDGKLIIDHGKRTDGEALDVKFDYPEFDNELYLHESERTPAEAISMLYPIYKYSVPGEMSDKNRKPYFKAMTLDELEDEDVMFGTPRHVAQFVLEFTILWVIMSGELSWEDFTGNASYFFWQCPYDKDFVIIKDWWCGKQAA